MKIGIDPSINSTGICILADKPIYYIITPHLTRKMKAIDNDRIHYIEYNKCDLNGNIRQIAYNIQTICNDYDIDSAIIEAPAFMASGRVVDLSLLNGYIRCILDLCIIDYKAVPPTSIKKNFCANGQADKDVMIASWKMLDPEMYEITKEVKQDDLADAYAMAIYE